VSTRIFHYKNVGFDISLAMNLWSDRDQIHAHVSSQ
jgi:hypothetical protein